VLAKSPQSWRTPVVVVELLEAFEPGVYLPVPRDFEAGRHQWIRKSARPAPSDLVSQLGGVTVLDSASPLSKGSGMPLYKVVELREGLIGGKMSGEKLEKVLNEHGSQGWVLKSITSVEVKGRMGPGGVDGLLITFEKQ